MNLDESVRAAAFAEYGVLGSAAEQDFDDIVRFAGALCEMPIALISFVERDRQWFKAKHGLDLDETPREISFCAHAMLGDTVMTIPDATRDPRFADNPLVTEAPGIRFYAGAPLVSPEGVPLGSLCVIDTVPRDKLTPLQLQGLSVLAAQVMAQLELRRRLLRKAVDDRLLAESDLKFRIIADTMPHMVWSTTADGLTDYYNARWYEFTGVDLDSTLGDAWPRMFHPDDREVAWAAWHHSVETGDLYEVEYRLRHHSGEYRWTLGRALPMRDEQGQITRWLGTCTDIHESRMLLEEREIIAHELSHRIKNIFAVIAGLISLSARTHPEIRVHAEDLRTRVLSLGRAHDFVRPHSVASHPGEAHSSLHGVLAELFAPYNGDEGGRILVRGADPAIDDRSATPLALLFHELATNAAKYGALSVQEGSVSIAIDRAGEDCVVDWRETGGPEVTSAPTHHGFGSRLVELSVSGQLHGTIAHDWNPGGLHARIIIPIESLARS